MMLMPQAVPLNMLSHITGVPLNMQRFLNRCSSKHAVVSSSSGVPLNMQAPCLVQLVTEVGAA
jgi:hypothetical protein